MTDYRTYAPVIIDTVLANPDDVSTAAVPMYFGALQPADLYWNASLVASAGAPISHGYVLSPIPDPAWPSVMQVDEDLRIRAQLIYGMPATVSEADFQLGKNVAFIGRANAWEAIHYRNVTFNSDGTVTLDRILRGVRGSWIHGYGHAIKDTIVFGSLGLTKFIRPFSEIGTTATVKIVPRGSPITTNTGLGGPLKVSGANAAPWAPINPHAVRSGSDLALSWTRVDRAYSTMHDLDDATPLTDTPERYSLYIFTSPANVGDSPKRSITGLTSPAYTYTAAQLAADGLDTASALILMIFQDGPTVGHGKPFYGAVNVS